MRAATIWLLLFVVTQVLVPAWRLFLPRPARFGWQMYSHAGDFPSVAVVRRATSDTVALDRVLAFPRADIQSVDHRALVRHLCRVLTDADSVRMSTRSRSQPGRRDTTVTPCR
jgi:hypothetical protein